MRKIFLGAILVFGLTNCSETENLTLSQELDELADSFQIFTIMNEKTDTIKTKSGVKIITRPNTFMQSDRQDAKEPILIELQEVFDKSEMILNGIGTVSNGKLLESFGMVFIKAMSDGEELTLRNDMPITISIPNKREGYNGELFYGTKTSDGLNWEYTGPKSDTIVVETIEEVKGGIEIVRVKTYAITNGLKVLISDTNQGLNYDSISTGEFEMKPFESYQFEITKLGWINCDRFINIVDKSTLEVELKNFSHPIGYLVFSNLNSVMGIMFDEQGVALIEELPDGYPVELVVIDKMKDKFFWVKKSLVNGSDARVILKTKAIDKKELKKELKKLDN